ncbi:uncharacterized protein LOC111882955 [Lactuca sativa]|uniref:U1-type domain-containing protein n=1 Tax=Lactuca sativa TaxID=4236 RepID=A0A9R1V6J7_LACSA|nr:uncharacterized protein LOC111882955 [Lactuca sativa]KAJ0199407.1 hypothetical protein LSAT_V11C600305740 [Lactuca sativa]
MDLSKLPDAQRQELEQLQKQFQEHQAQQQKQQQESAAAATAAAAAAAVQQQPPAYDQSQVQQLYDPSQAYDQSYYYNYNYQDPSQQQQQYDASYYQNYYPNAYQQHHPYTHPETLVATAVPSEQQQNAGSVSGSLGPGQVQDPYVHPGNQVNLGGTQGYPVPPGLNAAAAAAVAALSQLTQFAGTMGAAERASGGGYAPPPPMAGGGHYGQGHFRPPVGDHPPPPFYRGGGRRGGGPFRGGGRGFRPPNISGYGPPPFQGSGRGRGGGGRGRGRGRGGIGRHDQPFPPPSSHPVEGEKASEGEGEASLKIAWCELCRVDCTSKEILETHKSGKRHQKNLQMKGAYGPVGVGVGVEQTEKVEMKENEAATKADDEREKKPGGLKRKVKSGGGRGGKRQRQQGVGKPKVVIPLMCDLCNVKCDTQEVFERHVGGKKHIAKLKRFQGHQAMYGPTAVQALYPPNPLSQALAQAQPAYAGVGAPPSDQIQMTSYVAPQNPNPQLADAPLQFATQNANANAVSEEPPQPAGPQ